ncbi:GPCR kinase, partial [Tanacetum coccineum]
QKPVRLILGPAGIVQSAMLLKQRDILIGDIDNFLNSGKLDQVDAIVKSCSPNVIGDLTLTIKDLSGIIHGTIHYKVIDEGRYGKDITVGASLILANVSVFSPRPLVHYLKITMINVVKVFRKDTVHVTSTG